MQRIFNNQNLGNRNKHKTERMLEKISQICVTSQEEIR